MPPRRSAVHKIGVVGTINRDTIRHADGRVIHSWGGLLYNLQYLAADRSAVVIPVVNVGADCYRPIMRILRKFRRIDLSQVMEVDAANNHCLLRYSDQSHKAEILQGSVPPLTYDRLEPLVDCDLVLVNFISGRDVGLPALERFRRSFPGIIYMDIHSLTLGRRRVPDGYRRFLRRPRLWKRYAAVADILQLNRVEFELLAETEYNEQNARRFFARNLPLARGLVVTLGAGGCYVVSRDKQLKCQSVPAPVVTPVFDTTGCGDIFAAGAAAQYLATGDLVSAAREGNRLAAARCRQKTPVF
jgi:hypothetical protein